MTIGENQRHSEPLQEERGRRRRHEEEPQNKAHSRDATAVSIVRGGRRVGSFAESQQLAEGAPLMRMPLGVIDAW